MLSLPSVRTVVIGGTVENTMVGIQWCGKHGAVWQKQVSRKVGLNNLGK